MLLLSSIAPLSALSRTGTSFLCSSSWPDHFGGARDQQRATNSKVHPRPHPLYYAMSPFYGNSMHSIVGGNSPLVSALEVAISGCATLDFLPVPSIPAFPLILLALLSRLPSSIRSPCFSLYSPVCIGFFAASCCHSFLTGHCCPGMPLYCLPL